MVKHALIGSVLPIVSMWCRKEKIFPLIPWKKYVRVSAAPKRM